jgi:hypothetical protein
MGLADFVDGEASDNDKFRDASESSTNPISQKCLSKGRIFFGAGEVAFLLGYLRKTVSKTWCFGGEFVVNYMVNVVA